MAAERETGPARKPPRRRWNSKRKGQVSVRHLAGHTGKADRRQKISTTIAAQGYAFLEKLIQDGRARNLAEAIDLVLEGARRMDNRQRLERMTAAGYENMSPEAAAEEKGLSDALTHSFGELNLDE